VNIGSRDVGGDVSTNGVTVTGSTVRVELTTHVLGSDIELGEVSPTGLLALTFLLIIQRRTYPWTWT
jgi:hypothetical protein